jgi:hypothetical protein
MGVAGEFKEFAMKGERTEHGDWYHNWSSLWNGR